MTKRIVHARSKKTTKQTSRPPAPVRRVTADTWSNLGDIVSGIHDVDAALAMYEQTMRDEEEVELEDGTTIDPARPIALARRALGNLRSKVEHVQGDVEAECRFEASPKLARTR